MGSGSVETGDLSDPERTFVRTSAGCQRRFRRGRANAKGCLIFSRCALLVWPGQNTMENSYKAAGIDVHKKMLAVVVTDVAEIGEFRFERRKFGTGAEDL